jgi:hypothetical protein
MEGNERMDNMTKAEVADVRYLYNIVQPSSILIEGWEWDTMVVSGSREIQHLLNN